MFLAKCFSRVNSKTAFFVLKEAAAHVTDGGKIISIVTALLGAFTGYYTSYAGSKAPVEHFTRYVASPLSTEGLANYVLGVFARSFSLAGSV